MFELKRAAAQQLMKAIGGVQNIAGVHLVDRTSLIHFLDQIRDAENPEDALRERLSIAEPVPRPRHLKTALPDDLRCVMVRDLPSSIRLEQGRIEILGQGAEDILSSLLLLAQAIQNDLDTATDRLNPPLRFMKTDDDEIKALFLDLQRREDEYLRLRSIAS